MSTQPINAVVYHTVSAMEQPTLPTPLVRFAEQAIGPATHVERLSGEGAALVVAWHGRGGRAVLKAYRSPRPFGQERTAYRAWLPDLPRVPRLLAQRAADPPALLIEHMAGRAADSFVLDTDAERALHRDAGAWLRLLHGVPFRDGDPVPLAEAIAMRVRGWVELAEPGDASAAARWAGALLADAEVVLAGAARVPCHRDFEPRNWLVRPDAGLSAVIDFEHARPDHPLADLSRLAAYVWPARPDLEEAFLAGYGGLAEERRQLVGAFAAFDAAQRLGWALRRGDRTLAASARSALRALGAPISG